MNLNFHQYFLIAMRYLLVFKITAKVLPAGAIEGYEGLHAEA
jgi:hypothetical protein